jgi:hypothetical protein
MKLMRPITLIVGALIALLAVPALAQSPDGTPTNVRGKVAKLEGKTLTVTSRDGKAVPVTMADNFGVLGIVKAKLSDIKQGDFVGAAAVRRKDGKLAAQEVLIFPEAARGTGEGFYPWDLTTESTMTNATVAGVANQAKNGKGGRTLSLQYKGGENEIFVPSKTPVVSFKPADAKLLKKGATVFIRGLKKPDGSIVAQRAIAEQNGVKPPM